MLFKYIVKINYKDLEKKIIQNSSHIQKRDNYPYLPINKGPNLDFGMNENRFFVA